MATIPKWQYDETRHCGVDYSDQAQVEVYDKSHQTFRDYEKETEAIIDRLGIDTDNTIIDMGCGTGGFALHAAKKCKKVYATDISKAMLEYADQKAKKVGIKNIEFCHGGFLTYKHCGEPVDAIVSVIALHHLPDFWKLVGLKHIYDMLKPGGKFYLFDVVFSFDINNYKTYLDQWVEGTKQKVGNEMAAEVEIHASEEYSTFDWIMEEMLKKTGFNIEMNDYKNGVLATYLCKKI